MGKYYPRAPGDPSVPGGRFTSFPACVGSCLRPIRSPDSVPIALPGVEQRGLPHYFATISGSSRSAFSVLNVNNWPARVRHARQLPSLENSTFSIPALAVETGHKN